MVRSAMENPIIISNWVSILESVWKCSYPFTYFYVCCSFVCVLSYREHRWALGCTLRQWEFSVPKGTENFALPGERGTFPGFHSIPDNSEMAFELQNSQWGQLSWCWACCMALPLLRYHALSYSGVNTLRSIQWIPGQSKTCSRSSDFVSSVSKVHYGFWTSD